MATGYDTKNLVMQYHTQHNRRVRQADLKKFDFTKPGDLARLPARQGKAAGHRGQDTGKVNQPVNLWDVELPCTCQHL